ncbi:hypothetical protein B7494_g2699 [Chlorociboria aeruginascens]|nr:hypothetical protein B7494_g2699 [Chlorociboria aeruginascens]
MAATTIAPTEWVFPQSQVRHAARFHQDITQWFDIWSVENSYERPEMQETGWRESIAEILEIVWQETELIEPSKTMMGNISQDCTTAIMALLYCPVRLGVFVGFCRWLPDTSGLGQVKSGLATPVILPRCRDDDVVPFCNGEKLYRGLEELGMEATWRLYEDG